MLVAVSDGAQGIIAGWITTFGRVPLFYYLAHIYLLHASAIVFAQITTGSAGFAASHKPDGYGLGLAGIYTVWLATYYSIRSAAGLLRSSGGAPNGGGVIFNLVVGSREEAELQAHSKINDWLRKHPRKHSVGLLPAAACARQADR